MRQVTAVLLLFLYVFSSTEISELLKLPQLVQHYKIHKLEQKTVSFTSFLHQHYTQGDVYDADRNLDLELPYKSLDFTHAFSFTVIPTIISIEFATITDFGFSKSPLNGYTAVFSSSHFSSIWQPPKIA